MRKSIYLLLSAVFFFVLSSGVFAYDLTLTKIGTLSTIGADYSLVSYVGSVPMLEGTATPSAQVAVKINAVTGYSTTATSSGVWQFLPASLTVGDNLVTVTSGSQTLAFTIRYSLTSTTPTASSSATTLPASGTWENIVFGIVGGLVIMLVGGHVRQRMRRWEGK